MTDAPKKWEFDHPWQAVFLEGLSGKWLRLSHHGSAVASYEVAAWGSEQACIEAAWRYAYEPRADLCADPALLAEAVEVLRAFKAFDDMDTSMKRPDVFERRVRQPILAFLSKLENRHE